MSARGWGTWLLLAAGILGLGLRVQTPYAPVRPPAPYYAVADTDSTAPRKADVSGDLLLGLEEDGEAVELYIGNVAGKQDSTILFANWGKRFKARKQVLLTGDVLIIEDGDSLRADTVFYDEINKIGRARGRVRLSDGEVVVLAPSGLYFIDEKRARFEEGVLLIDSTAEITSHTGTYWSDEKRAELEGAVQLQAERTYLEADSLTYFRENEVSVARGQVFIERIGGEEDTDADSTIRTLLFSEWAYNDQQAGLSRIRGRPLLVQLRQDSTDAEVDTLVIRALQLEALEQDALRRLIAVDSVQIWQPDMAAVADSVLYERFEGPADASLASVPHSDSTGADTLQVEEVPADTIAVAFAQADSLQADSLQTPSTAVQRIEETRLYRGPVLWFGETQVVGDTIRVKGPGGEVDSLFVRQNAFVAQRDTALGRINQVRGQHLVGYFEEDSVRVFVVGPNAETIYFRRDEDGRPNGGLQISGDQAIFRFRGDDPEDIVFGEHQGTYYPESVLPSPFELDGFHWQPERRPSKAALLREERVVQRLSRYAIHPGSPPDSLSAGPRVAPDTVAVPQASAATNQ